MDIETFAILNKKVSDVEETVASLGKGYTYKGSVAAVADLPSSGTLGDMYTITGENNMQYVWNGAAWINKDSAITGLSQQLSELDSSAVMVTPQTFSDAEQSQAQINIGIKPKIIKSIIFDGSPTTGQVLFDLSDVSVGDIIKYNITLPENPKRNNLGCIELYDANNNRFGLIGRTTGADESTSYVSAFEIPVGFDHAKWLTNITSGIVNVYIGKEYKEEILYNGAAIPNRILFTSDDVNVGAEIDYSFQINYQGNGKYFAGFLSVYLKDGTRYSWYGKGSTNADTYTNPYSGIFVVPESFSYAMWDGYATSQIEYIKAIVPYEYDADKESIDNPYKRYAIKEYGALLNGYPHCGFPRICAFDSRLVIVYRCGMRHRTEGGNGIVQIDAVGLDGEYRHIKSFSANDFEGVTGTDARDFYCMCTPDENYLIIFGGFGKGNESDGYSFDLVMACLDKDFNIVSYKVFADSTDYPYGNMLITPQGKIIFSSFNQSLHDSAIYMSNQVFADNETALSNLTFEKITLFTPENTGASSMSECCLGYFNNNLVIAVRIDESSKNYTPIRVTSDLEGSSGWGNVIKLQGVRSHSPVLLPYYNGRYLPFMCSKVDTTTGERIPLFGYIDITNNAFLCYGNIDKSLIKAPNGYPWFYNLGSEIYAVVYYQEAVTSSATATELQSNTGLYYKWINARVLLPKINTLNLSE